ncbi:hypothetical protein EC988_001280 [Linderina pennispora]|nr:hypothetical protein EC988_001280 [Linderina pennispora]
MKVAYLSGQQQPELQQPEDNGEDNNEYEAADDSDGVKVATVAESNECTYTNQDMGDLLRQVVVENNVTAETTGPHPSIDILLTFDWPYGIGPDQPEPEHASNKISFISATTKPRYHFAASEGTFFERQPYKYSNKIKVGSGSKSAGHFTRFIGLGSVRGGREKQRWFYAMNIMPLQSSNCGDTSPSQVPENSTENPHRAHFPSSNGIMSREELHRIMASINLSGFQLGILPKGKPRGKRDGPDLKRQKGAPPPLDYTCNICKVGGHWIRDCPERHQAERKPRSEIPPEGYVCYKCRKPGHWKEKCPNLDIANNLINIAQTCWFCLSNPNVDQNLIVAIGDEAYVAMAKGPLVTGPAGAQSGNSTAWEQGEVSPIPGGGHAMIVPIEHVSSMRDILSGDQQNDLKNETDKWTRSLTALYAEYDCVPLMFEVCRYAPHVHTAIQAIPIPKTKIDQVKLTLDSMAREDNLLTQSNYPRDKKDGYVWVSTPTTGAKPTCVKIPAKEKRFNLQYGRRLAARILGIPSREDWKSCTVSDKEEARQRDAFIKVFSKHDFMSGKD